LTAARPNTPKPGGSSSAAVSHHALTLLVLATLGLPALAALVLLFVRKADVDWWLVWTLYGATTIALFMSRAPWKRASGLALCLSALSLVTLWPEMALRLAGFRFETRSVVQFGWPTPQDLRFMEADPELFWRLPSSWKNVNSDGFFGPEIVPKPAGTWRMAFFGDSCTEQGYCDAVPPLLHAAHPNGPRFEAINLGVAGYTSYQGRVVAERMLGKTRPDLAAVCYGWNDHWLAYGAPDSAKAAKGDPAPNWLRRAVTLSRVLQWAVKLRAAGHDVPLDQTRVNPGQYRRNLLEIGRLIEAAGGQVLLMTAATSHVHQGVPEQLVERHFAPSKEEIVALHKTYNEIVRGVAAERDWLLLDLAASADSLPRVGDLFTDDGIHYTDPGLDWVTAQVSGLIARQVLPAALKRGAMGRSQ